MTKIFDLISHRPARDVLVMVDRFDTKGITTAITVNGFKALASSDPSLNLPLLPPIEEDKHGFTDSFDKNNNKIYEGDLVHIQDSPGFMQFHKKNEGIVTWGKGNYYVKGTYIEYNVYAWQKSITVIKAANRVVKAKQYTEEDMRLLYEGTVQNVGVVKREDMPTWEQVLAMLSRQSLPKQVEIEIECTHSDHAPNGIDCGPKVDANNFVKVVRWIYDK